MTDGSNFSFTLLIAGTGCKIQTFSQETVNVTLFHRV